MPVGFRAPNGIDLESLFATRRSDPGGLTGFRGPSGADLAYSFERFAGSGQLPYFSGFRNGAGQDFRDLFTTSAQQAIGGDINNNSFYPEPNVQVWARVFFERNGTLSLISGNSAMGDSVQTLAWNTVPSATVGDSYDILLDTNNGMTGGPFDQWMRLNVSRGVSVAPPRGGSGSGSCRYIIRRASDQQWEAIGNIYMSAEAG